MTIYTDTALKAYLEQAGFCKMQQGVLFWQKGRCEAAFYRAES